MNQTTTDQAVADAVREILGTEMDAWIAGAGMERVTRKLRTPTEPINVGAEESTLFTVRLAGWRSCERDCAITRAEASPTGDVTTWIQNLVNDEKAFSAYFDNPNRTKMETDETRIEGIRITHMTTGHGRVLPWKEYHRTWPNLEAAREDIAHADANCLPAGPLTDQRITTVRLGRATHVTYRINVSANRNSITDIATTARANADLLDEQAWEPTAKFNGSVRHAVWLKIGIRQWTAPSETRLLQHYLVHVGRLRGEIKTIVVHGPREHHEPMLEDAITAAAHCEDWYEQGEMSDYVDSYAAMTRQGQKEYVTVPKALRMLERI